MPQLFTIVTQLQGHNILIKGDYKVTEFYSLIINKKR
jgi:hypothetical protein